jgi:hypothetical protein
VAGAGHLDRRPRAAGDRARGGDRLGGFIDILCINEAGELVIVELKRDRTPREVTAQALDYASWVAGLSNERVRSIADAHLGAGFVSAFTEKFGSDLPETLNGDRRILIVGSEVDASSERIIKYLSDAHGVSINAATFHYFKQADGSELLARVFLIELSEAERNVRTKGSSKRRPNLTYEELRDLAVEAAVTELYDHAVAALEPVLQKRRTQSSIAFAGTFGESKRTVLSLVPGESSAAEGLRYQLYNTRYAELTGLSPAEVEQLLPEPHQHWAYDAAAGPDWQGFEGFITTPEEVDRLVSGLLRAPARTTP